MRNALSVIGLLSAFAVSAGGQGTRDITGKVTQSGSSAPIPEASVSIFGQPVGVRVNVKVIHESQSVWAHITSTAFDSNGLLRLIAPCKGSTASVCAHASTRPVSSMREGFGYGG